MSLSPKDMDFIEAKNGAAREIALAFGVPPMLLGIPGDNTYANYQEANRAFWRADRAAALRRGSPRRSAGGSAPAFGDGAAARLRLWYDADQVEALSSEREALWARVGAAEFLTVNEKRAAVGYGPVEGGEGMGAGRGQVQLRPGAAADAEGPQHRKRAMDARGAQRLGHTRSLSR